MPTNEEWNAQVRAGQNNTWIHSDHKITDAYALGQSQGGWTKKSSPWPDFGAQPRGSNSTGFAGPIKAASTTATNGGNAAYNKGTSGGDVFQEGGAGYRYRFGVLGSIKVVLIGSIKVVLILALWSGVIFGFYDYFANGPGIERSSRTAFNAVYVGANVIETKIERIGKAPILEVLAGDIVFFSAIPVMLLAGAGAAAGQIAATLADGFPGAAAELFGISH
jgi:hypothetical protein